MRNKIMLNFMEYRLLEDNIRSNLERIKYRRISINYISGIWKFSLAVNYSLPNFDVLQSGANHYLHIVQSRLLTYSCIRIVI